ncbi:S-adenosyl-L-methionine-dependent methyltransferase [Coprinellus micaceus]|uniref:S-adenosyl-L-methionine-dependent methyltransferase n=1 Tax=Coprinellus micaceus TaxID=71717 RepID=A0A4Y7T6R4_COPMI|nr:S-adenosyl-L-methionine-dependent methyltransferase [Coprinellus micaceus]
MSSGTRTNRVMESKKEDQKKVQQIVRPDDPLSWDNAWKQNITPWDMGGVQPSLKEVMENSRIPFPRSGKVLVPGCGTGYDVFYFASLGLKAMGMDISETAVEAAYKARYKEPQNVFDNSDFVAANFFEYSNIIFPEDRFNLVYDHTFFVAIPPAKRSDWGKEMAALIKPGGYLITVVFPILPQTSTGPPYYVRPEHYDEHLQANFEKIYSKVPTKSSPSHEGLEHVVVWLRKNLSLN